MEFFFIILQAHVRDWKSDLPQQRLFLWPWFEASLSLLLLSHRSLLKPLPDPAEWSKASLEVGPPHYRYMH